MKNAWMVVVALAVFAFVSAPLFAADAQITPANPAPSTDVKPATPAPSTDVKPATPAPSTDVKPAEKK